MKNSANNIKYKGVNFPVDTFLAASHKFWFVVFLFAFESFVIQECINVHIFMYFPGVLLLLISKFIQLWLENLA